MSCINPIKIKNPNFKSGGIRSFERIKYYDVPCGKCIQCMKTKMQWLETACEYEYNYYGCGAFVTLTYDEEHYIHLFNEKLKIFEVNYKDFQDFIKRLRQRLYRKYNVRHEFKYLAVSEMGGKTGRIHFHVLFFGLDYNNNEYDIYSTWENGMIDCKPIDTQGKAIRYVLKYMTKDEMYNRKEYKFEKNNQPFCVYSKGLGKGFIDKNIKFIYENNGCYDRGDGRLRTLPPYWCNRLRLKPITSYNEIRKEMFNNGYTKHDKRKWYEISKVEAMQYNYDKSLKKEEIAREESRKKGIPQRDIDYLSVETYRRNTF